MKNLVIVESPAKCKTIEKYLGSDYKVVSSKGHIRDLATTGKFGLGIDVEHDFEPNYQIIKGKNKEVTALKKEVKEAALRLNVSIGKVLKSPLEGLKDYHFEV